MKLLLKRIITVFITMCLLAGTVLPSLQPSFASNAFDPAFTYNLQTNKWDITWAYINGSDTYSVFWHGPDGSLVSQTEVPLVFEGTQNIISLSFQPDHIYDLTFSFQDSEGEPVEFTNKYGNTTEEETVFFLSKITFHGTSFNDMAVLGGLEDAYPKLIPDDGNPPQTIISGQEPRITLKWKVPTIWEETAVAVLPITHMDVNLAPLESENTPHIPLDYSYFHIKMNEVTNIVTPRELRSTVDQDGTIFIGETGDLIEGFDGDGNVTTGDGFVYFTLDQSDGIIPGTEYENVSIKLTFKSGTSEALYTRLKNGAASYPVNNKDNIFQQVGEQITSIFTPLKFEVSKVDIDKLELRIYKIKSKNYSELYYQVQDAGSIVELLEGSGQSGSGIKLPDASIPDSTGWGSIIVEIPLNQNGEHPERYYRFVVTDGNSRTPLGTLAIDIRDLGNDTGKPPVPREIRVETVYNGKQDVLYKNPADGANIRIPLSDLRISFEKPLLWRTLAWEDIVNSSEEAIDFTFHLLLNTYLSDDVKIMETKVIGDEQVAVFVPVKEKRVLNIGKNHIDADKNQLQEDPDDSSRLIFEVEGSRLFFDYTTDTDLDFENNVDTDINGQPDYPDFLLPNTTYYLRMFSTRARDNEDINWTLRDELNFEDKISYISPVVSFTTYPSREMPVPLPNLTLDVDIDPEPHPETGKPVFNGIAVSFPKILDDNDWLNYTNITENRRIVYDLYISDSTDEESFILLEPPFMNPLETLYPDENPSAGLSTLITRFPAGEGEDLKPNTTYYFKARAKLYVNGEEDPFIFSDETPIKSITTPKTDSGSLDDIDRVPRTPVEFSIAKDAEGELELTDAKVVLNWLHAEQDVTYEMVCTRSKLSANAAVDDYINDIYHIGDTVEPGFMRVYQNYKTNTEDTELHIDVVNTPLSGVGFKYNENNTRIAKLPINLPFLKPNHLYYFSLRAVRDRGAEDAVYSSWVSIPVTTKMVAPPDFLEAVTDVQLGFNVRRNANIPSEDMKIMIKKGYLADSAYIELSRAKYSVVKDGNIYYVRIFDLDPNTWYDIHVFYTKGDGINWYDSEDEVWRSYRRVPLQMETRNTLNEIEVRFAGESLYEYFLEVRTDDDEDYIPLQYSTAGETDYGYTLDDGSLIEFYREKTQVYVEDGLAGKYIYYAKISSARQKRSDGTYKRLPLISNTRYYIKAWARNIEDSKHIGPVTVRTDFSQEDYDKGYIKDQVRDMFQSKADALTRKLYFTVNEADKTSNRVLLKGARISNLLQMSGHSGVTVDISKEIPEALKDIVLIPYEILSTLQEYKSRLTLRIDGCEITITADTLDLDNLKKLAQTTGVKETMLELTVERKQTGSIAPPQGFDYGSRVYDIGMKAIGMRRTYAGINEMIYDILMEPDTKGPFKYGIFDRELVKLLEKGTTLTYRSYVELESMINLIVDQVEEELSLYIQDILDGGRGLTASKVIQNNIPELNGGLRLKILHKGSGNLVEPYVLISGQTAWKEPAGVKAWVFPHVLVTAKNPGQYVVFQIPGVTIPEDDGLTYPGLQRLAQKYDLKKVFNSGTIYPGDFVTGDKAVVLFEVVTETTKDVNGLSVPAKVKYYNLDGILPAAAFQPNINRGQAASLAVEIYAYKTGISSAMMRPSVRPYIENADALSDPVYHRLVIALDLGITSVEADYTYAGDRLVTVDELLCEVVKVLELLGEL